MKHLMPVTDAMALLPRHIFALRLFATYSSGIPQSY